jgi:hypothetical protein
MRRSTGGWSLALSLIVLLAVAVGGAANAYWRASGSGTASGTTGTTTSVTLSPGTATAELYPGGTTDIELTVGNPNPSPVRLVSLGPDTSRGTGGFSVDAGHSGCTPLSTLSLALRTNGGAGWTVPARAGAVDGALAITLTGALAMSTSAANACQDASFTVYLAAGP